MENRRKNIELLDIDEISEITTSTRQKYEVSQYFDVISDFSNLFRRMGTVMNYAGDSKELAEAIEVFSEIRLIFPLFYESTYFLEASIKGEYQTATYRAFTAALALGSLITKAGAFGAAGATIAPILTIMFGTVSTARCAKNTLEAYAAYRKIWNEKDKGIQDILTALENTQEFATEISRYENAWKILKRNLFSNKELDVSALKAFVMARKALLDKIGTKDEAAQLKLESLVQQKEIFKYEVENALNFNIKDDKARLLEEKTKCVKSALLTIAFGFVAISGALILASAPSGTILAAGLITSVILCGLAAHKMYTVMEEGVRKSVVKSLRDTATDNVLDILEKKPSEKLAELESEYEKCLSELKINHFGKEIPDPKDSTKKIHTFEVFDIKKVENFIEARKNLIAEAENLKLSVDEKIQLNILKNKNEILEKSVATKDEAIIKKALGFEEKVEANVARRMRNNLLVVGGIFLGLAIISAAFTPLSPIPAYLAILFGSIAATIFAVAVVKAVQASYHNEDSLLNTAAKKINFLASKKDNNEEKFEKMDVVVGATLNQ